VTGLGFVVGMGVAFGDAVAIIVLTSRSVVTWR